MVWLKWLPREISNGLGRDELKAVLIYKSAAKDIIKDLWGSTYHSGR